MSDQTILGRPQDWLVIIAATLSIQLSLSFFESLLANSALARRVTAFFDMSSTLKIAGIEPLEFNAGRYLDQTQSPLFSVLPAEIRNLLFSFALLETEDITRPYHKNTCYARPDFLAPKRVDASLLQTCQRVYGEAWFRPFIATEHTLFLTSNDRRPARVTTRADLAATLARMKEHGFEAELAHVRVFAQLYSLEPGKELQSIFLTPNLRPRTITVTLRHTDWWSWENDADLMIRAAWLNTCRFPSSTTEIRMELECALRRQSNLDSIADQMMTQWKFRREDDMIMTAEDSPVVTMTWKGSSTWQNRRWLRDETEPEVIEYYVRTVIWRPQIAQAVRTDMADDGGKVREDGDDPSRAMVNPDLHTLTTAVRHNEADFRSSSLTLGYLQGLDIQPGASAEDIWLADKEHRQQQHQGGQNSDRDEEYMYSDRDEEYMYSDRDEEYMDSEDDD